jgi:hypothetical protein
MGLALLACALGGYVHVFTNIFSVCICAYAEPFTEVGVYSNKSQVNAYGSQKYPKKRFSGESLDLLTGLNTLWLKSLGRTCWLCPTFASYSLECNAEEWQVLPL